MAERVQTRAEVYRNRGRRLDAEQRAQRQAREAQAKAARAEALRARGRVIDQTEHCYRQHTPPQIAHADEMCGGLTNLVVPWEDIAS